MEPTTKVMARRGLRLWLTVLAKLATLVGGWSYRSLRALASRLQDSPVIQGAARTGFVVNGLLHIVIGAIAVSIAFGGTGKADQGGALASLADRTGGVVLLAVTVAGLIGLGLFQLLEAAIVRGTDGQSWASRAKEAGKGIAYLAVGSTAFFYLIGRSPDSGEKTRDFTAGLLAAPGGIVVLVIVAIVVVVVGAYFVVKGVRRRFLKDIAEPEGAPTIVISVLGIGGYIAKGVALVVVGLLFAAAAISLDPSAATGLDGALRSLADAPFGVALLTIVGCGFIAYGLYCFVRSRYAEL
ncbi:MAG: hypothetical protein JWQ43_816 [Glaciihabitans sp.]|nr:hypothetical protein [Glaciihabitans sp.]